MYLIKHPQFHLTVVCLFNLLNNGGCCLWFILSKGIAILFFTPFPQQYKIFCSNSLFKFTKKNKKFKTQMSSPWQRQRRLVASLSNGSFYGRCNVSPTAIAVVRQQHFLRRREKKGRGKRVERREWKRKVMVHKRKWKTWNRRQESSVAWRRHELGLQREVWMEEEKEKEEKKGRGGFDVIWLIIRGEGDF